MNTFHDMHLFGCTRTVKSLNATLKVLTQMFNLAVICLFLEEVPWKLGIRLDVVSVNVVISAFSDMGILEKG